MPTRVLIDRFLTSERIALIGVSREPKKFANVVFREYAARGYEMVPVNPHADVVEGVVCHRSVADLPDVDAAIVMVSSADAADVVRQCADRGIRRVWLHKGAGVGSCTDAAVEVGRERGIEVVDGACPLMFLDGTGFIHRLHRLVSGSRIAPARQ